MSIIIETATWPLITRTLLVAPARIGAARTLSAWLDGSVTRLTPRSSREKRTE